MYEKPSEALFRPAMVLMSGRLLGLIAAFVIPMVLARFFTQEEFGTYKQLFLIYGTLFAFAQLGMAESLYYFLPHDSRSGGRYVLNALLVLGGFGALLLVALWAFQGSIAALMSNSDLTAYIPYIGVYLLFMLMAAVLEIAMTAKKHHLAASCTYAVSDLLRALLYISPVLLFGTLRWLLLGAIAFAACRFLATLAYVVREFRTPMQPDRGLLRRHLAYALPFGLAAALEIVQLNFHLYAVSYSFDAATFAIYAVGCLQIPLVDFLMTSTSNVMMVNMREKIKQGKDRQALGIWLDASRKLGLILFPMVGGLLVVAHELIVLLFTSTYESSVPIFMLWTLTMAISAILTDGVLRVFAENRFLIVQNFLRLLLIAVTIHWFMSRFGLLGAIMATFLAAMLTKVLALTRVKSILGTSWSQVLPWGSLAMIITLASASAIPAVLIKLLLDLPMLVEFLLAGFVYALSYFLLLLWGGPMDAEEKAELTQWTALPFTHLRRLCKA